MRGANCKQRRFGDLRQTTPASAASIKTEMEHKPVVHPIPPIKEAVNIFTIYVYAHRQVCQLPFTLGKSALAL